MADAPSLTGILADRALARIEDEASQRGIRVIFGSNVSPEIVAFDARQDGNFLGALGVKAYARVEDGAGNVLATYGETSPKDIARALALWGGLALVLLFSVRGFIK